MNDPIVCALMVEAMALQARIEGMKAENAQRALEGKSPAYGEEQFESEGSGFRHIAEALRGRA